MASHLCLLQRGLILSTLSAQGPTVVCATRWLGRPTSALQL